jgi:hypothetical protein
MKSKLLQKIGCGVNQSREVVDGKQENIEIRPSPGRGASPDPNGVNPASDAEARKDFPALLKRNYRPARS